MAFPGITNYVEIVPGTDVTCYLGVRDSRPNEWIYSLWTGEGDDEMALVTGSLDLSGLSVTPQQVARVAFLLEVDYAL